MTLLLTLAGCSQVEDSVRSDEEQTEVSFSCYLSQSKKNDGSATRTAYPSDGEGGMTTAKLKETGFSVFSIYTEDNTYTRDNANSGTKAFNFMWNQDVQWDATLSQPAWTYTPVKYWPNDNNPADDQTPPATGSQTHSYLSFFAYAPYQDNDELTGLTSAQQDEATGVVAFTANSTASQESKVTYRLNTSLLPPDNIDLLWTRNIDRYKMDGAGYVNGQVQLQFIHALSKVKFVARTLVDQTTTDDTDPQYPHDVDANTKIFIERVEITAPSLYKEAKMSLVPNPVNGTVPVWSDRTTPITPSVTGSILHSDLKWGSNPADRSDASAAATDFAALAAGVTSTDHDLFADADNNGIFLIPTAAKERLTIRVVYHVVTYDPSLKLNTPKYYSLVTNDISYTTPDTDAGKLQFEPNKVYTIRLLLGLTTVKFEVDAVDDWADPIVLDGVVRDPNVETHEYNVE